MLTTLRLQWLCDDNACVHIAHMKAKPMRLQHMLMCCDMFCNATRVVIIGEYGTCLAPNVFGRYKVLRHKVLNKALGINIVDSSHVVFVIE